LVFFNAGEDLIMLDVVFMPLNPLVMTMEKEKFEKTSFDVNVS
jgi:hypothetical protein